MKKIIFMFMCALLFAGCSASETPKEVELDNGEAVFSNYSLVAVEKTDVVNMETISLSYSATKTEEYSFMTPNTTIEFVYVSRGDIVRKGDVLASLECEDLKSKIDSYKHEIKLTELSKTQLIERRDLEIEKAKHLFAYGKEEKDPKVLEENIESITKSYVASIKNYEDSLTILKLRLAEAEKEYKDSRIIATVDGGVSFCRGGLEGSRVNPGEVVIRVYDSSECLFVSLEKSKANLVHEGEEYTLSIGTGASKREYVVTPVRMDEWTSDLYFAPIGNYDPISINDHGKIEIVVEEAKDVIAVPTNVLHSSNGKNFVYYLDDKGVRRIKWVEIGLKGTTYTEIVSGLSEGEFVISSK